MSLFEDNEITFKGEDYLYSELNKFMNNFLQNNCLNLFRSYVGLKKIFQNNKKNLFVIAQHALGFHGLVGELSKQYKITSLLISHGSHIRQNNKYSELAWEVTNKTLINANFTFSAMQTPLAYDYFKNLQIKKAKPLITGPMIFGIKKISRFDKTISRELIFKENSKKFIFLHAGTPKYWDFFRPLNYESLDEYISNLIDVINAVNKNKNNFLAVRFRETKYLSLELLKQFLPKYDCFKIYSEGDISDYINQSDCLISYSSTTIEEALINQTPVLLYNPKGHYFHINGQLLEANKYPKNIKTVYNVKSKKDLLWGLDWVSCNQNNNQKKLNWDGFSFDKNLSNSYHKIVQKL